MALPMIRKSMSRKFYCPISKYNEKNLLGGQASYGA
jgi:hypothetical protein